MVTAQSLISLLETPLSELQQVAAALRAQTDRLADLQNAGAITDQQASAIVQRVQDIKITVQAAQDAVAAVLPAPAPQ